MDTIGKYQVQSVLGRGGMGTVYEALDPYINRKVALKTMIAGLGDNAELKARFLREAQSAGGLRHRNIVTVYDLGEDKGQPYIAMEYIEGTDLEKVIQSREPRSVEWKLDVLRQICEGLGYAHKAGIVHRDIKPANVRVTPDGEVKIMDFGIAHLQSSTMTKSGLVLGTVHYMAPEQIEGQKVDHRADIFSVGAIAYELIAYKRPFDGDTITAVMYKIMHDRADPKVLPETEYSPVLQQIIMRALARDVRERYQSLDEMRSDLVAAVRRMPTKVGTAVPPPPPARSVPEPDAARGQEIARLRADLERARAEGQLQRAALVCRRLLDLVPQDKDVAALSGKIEAAIQERQVEQLCETATAYAAAGDIELAGTIMGKVEKMAPQSPRYQKLKAYLSDEASRRGPQAARPTPGAVAAAATATPPPAAAPVATPAPVSTAAPVATPSPAAVPASSGPSTGVPEARRSEVEALTNAALDHFLQNNHAKARKAIDKALAIDPGNKKAREMLRILGSLG